MKKGRKYHNENIESKKYDINIQLITNYLYLDQKYIKLIKYVIYFYYIRVVLAVAFKFFKFF